DAGGPCLRARSRWCGRTGVIVVPVGHGSLGQREEVAQLTAVELGDPLLAGADDLRSEVAFLIEQAVDLLLDGASADQLVDLDRALLADAVRTVCGLVFDGGVPPAVEVKDVVGRREIEAGATRL